MRRRAAISCFLGIWFGLYLDIYLDQINEILYDTMETSKRHLASAGLDWQQSLLEASSPSIKKDNARIKRQYRRKFVAYHSSPWEQQWLIHADEWSANLTNYIRVLQEDQKDLIHDFMLATCTDELPNPHSDWCMQQDFYRAFFYNKQSRQWVCQASPAGRRHFIKLMGQTKSLGPLQPGKQYEHIFSRFEYLDQETGETYFEYIEPLVAGLRHPWARLNYAGNRSPNPVIDFRGYIIPPPPPRGGPYQKSVYIDAGSSTWATGLGGPSLDYFTKAWKRQGIDFSKIYAYEPSVRPIDFDTALPEEYKNRTQFWQTYIASSPDAATPTQPFLPLEIKDRCADADYVLLKLDIDSPSVEDGSIRYLLEHDDIPIDELAWEHHVQHHPVMGKIWQTGKSRPNNNLNLGDSMKLFLKLRQKGIRAHSWV
ncbi:expressed unknown protein [Seminavis robusta]|uniref:Uncharacterized protein n=1 Tax=Seminavis robusta TaxID=568900 RepID=A0A9N8HCZ9_9STRA|nr:expressed unknown protein [Seminavis robusta]|eukprot:Sro403_g135700.1 n/a (426) ;mRNA; f:38301-39578